MNRILDEIKKKWEEYNNESNFEKQENIETQIKIEKFNLCLVELEYQIENENENKKKMKLIQDQINEIEIKFEILEGLINEPESMLKLLQLKKSIHFRYDLIMLDDTTNKQRKEELLGQLKKQKQNIEIEISIQKFNLKFIKIKYQIEKENENKKKMKLIQDQINEIEIEFLILEGLINEPESMLKLPQVKQCLIPFKYTLVMLDDLTNKQKEEIEGEIQKEQEKYEEKIHQKVEKIKNEKEQEIQKLNGSITQDQDYLNLWETEQNKISGLGPGMNGLIRLFSSFWHQHPYHEIHLELNITASNKLGCGATCSVYSIIENPNRVLKVNLSFDCLKKFY